MFEYFFKNSKKTEKKLNNNKGISIETKEIYTDIKAPIKDNANETKITTEKKMIRFIEEGEQLEDNLEKKSLSVVQLKNYFDSIIMNNKFKQPPVNEKLKNKSKDAKLEDINTKSTEDCLATLDNVNEEKKEMNIITEKLFDANELDEIKNIFNNVIEDEDAAYNEKNNDSRKETFIGKLFNPRMIQKETDHIQHKAEENFNISINMNETLIRDKLESCDDNFRIPYLTKKIMSDIVPISEKYLDEKDKNESIYIEIDENKSLDVLPIKIGVSFDQDKKENYKKKPKIIKDQKKDDVVEKLFCSFKKADDFDKSNKNNKTRMQQQLKNLEKKKELFFIKIETPDGTEKFLKDKKIIETEKHEIRTKTHEKKPFEKLSAKLLHKTDHLIRKVNKIIKKLENQIRIYENYKNETEIVNLAHSAISLAINSGDETEECIQQDMKHLITEIDLLIIKVREKNEKNFVK